MDAAGSGPEDSRQGDRQRHHPGTMLGSIDGTLQVRGGVFWAYGRRSARRRTIGSSLSPVGSVARSSDAEQGIVIEEDMRAMNSSMVASKGRAIRRRLGGRIKAIGWLLPVPLPAFQAVHLQTHQKFVDYREREREELENRLRLMWEMARPGGIITTRGYCICCRQASEFVTDAEAHPSKRSGDAGLA